MGSHVPSACSSLGLRAHDPLPWPPESWATRCPWVCERGVCYQSEFEAFSYARTCICPRLVLLRFWIIPRRGPGLSDFYGGIEVPSARFRSQPSAGHCVPGRVPPVLTPCATRGQSFPAHECSWTWEVILEPASWATVAVKERAATRKGPACQGTRMSMEAISLGGWCGGSDGCLHFFPRLLEALGAWRGPSQLIFQSSRCPLTRRSGEYRGRPCSAR